MCRLTERVCTRDRLESRIANRECDRRSAQSSIAEPLHRFLAKQAERRVERGAIIRVKRKRLVVGDRFRLGVDEKLVRVAAARLAVQRRAPAAEILLELFLCGGRKLRNDLNPQRVQRRFGDLADPRNAPHTEGREKRFLASSRDPQQASWFGLIA